ncbi:repressor LexA [Paenibacillus algorifonticola]|uniref:Repressor LexA n=1 Tax=Paenibacillus algorifonticola TaxID=684063 RepID=A0A1I2H0B0_9BACL|nr:XRE family transcriptional regulator [Paenibacillus algorifonticola]SFF22427.1 repressor LexA [Paenibacillus algorifonticola]
MYGPKLRALRNIEGWTQEFVAKKLGVSKQTYSHYENEKRTPSLDMIKKLASFYGVDIDDVFADESTSSVVTLPIYTRIDLITGIPSPEDIVGFEVTPKEWLSAGEYFYFRAADDSMTGARIHKGDLLLIRAHSPAANGEIVLAVANGSAVLRRIYQNGEQTVLQAENPQHPPLFCAASEITVVGKVIKTVINF